MENSKSKPWKKRYRNWADLPKDTTLTILTKIGQLDILNSVQFVCKTWYTLCKEPSLWRDIHLHNTHTPFISRRYDGMLLSALAHCARGLVRLDIECFGSDQLLTTIAYSSTQLKHLRIADCRNCSTKALAGALKKLTSLQELELTLCSFKKTVPIIRACSQSLTSFKLNKIFSPYDVSDDEAFAIARSMPNLRHLQLIGNNMRNAGLAAILNGCPRLEALDLRACLLLDFYYGDYLEEYLSENIKNVRLPEDSTKDYNYPTVDDDKISDDIDSDDGNVMENMYWDEFDPVFCDGSSDDDGFIGYYTDYYSL